jgi:hypothetical protein
MFNRVNRAFLAENFLRARNAQIVSPPMPEVSESGTLFGAGQCGQPRAARSSMEIQTQARTESAQRANRWRENLIYVGTIFKYSAKAIFDDDGEM